MLVYFSGDWDVPSGHDLDFDPWLFEPLEIASKLGGIRNSFFFVLGSLQIVSSGGLARLIVFLRNWPNSSRRFSE